MKKSSVNNGTVVDQDLKYGGHSVQQTVDGGFIVTGDELTGGAGEPTVFLLKTDGQGNI